MGTTGDKPRKPRRRMARVSKYPDASGNPLAGLTGDGDGGMSDRAPVADHPSTITPLARSVPGSFGYSDVDEHQCHQQRNPLRHQNMLMNTNTSTSTITITGTNSPLQRSTLSLPVEVKSQRQFYNGQLLFEVI